MLLIGKAINNNAYFTKPTRIVDYIDLVACHTERRSCIRQYTRQAIKSRSQFLLVSDRSLAGRGRRAGSHSCPVPVLSCPVLFSRCHASIGGGGRNNCFRSVTDLTRGNEFPHPCRSHGSNPSSTVVHGAAAGGGGGVGLRPLAPCECQRRLFRFF